MNEATPTVVFESPEPNGVFARWRATPKYRLNNLAGDPTAWRTIGVGELEVLSFDQSIVFGAAFPGTASELAAAMRRDAVVRQARDAAWTVHRAYAFRADAERRLRFVRELAAAIEIGTGSAGSLLPAISSDGDPIVAAEARRLIVRLAEATRA